MPGWKCQFEKPTIVGLIGDLEPEKGQLLKRIRKSILAEISKKPTLEWLGLTLRWCETTTPREGSTLLKVHIVPDPTMPRVVMTVSTAFFEKHPPAQLPRALHPGLELATTIGHQTWVEFPIQSTDTADAIESFLKLAHDA